MKTLRNFCNRYRLALRIYGCFALSIFCIAMLAGCSAPAFLADLESILPLVGTGITGLLAILGADLKDPALTAAATEAQGILTAASAELDNINTIVADYKANPSDTLLEEIETAVNTFKANLASTLTVAGLSAATAATIQNTVNTLTTQLENLLSTLPVFKTSTAGVTLTVTKPIPAAAFKAEIHAALTTPAA